MTFSAKILIRWEKVSLAKYYEGSFVFQQTRNTNFFLFPKCPLFFNQFAIQELKLFSECFSTIFNRCFVFSFSG